jgi:hypothetical protein
MRPRFSTLLLLALACAALASEGFQPLRGPYMGQEVGDTPRVFLPGKISTGHDEGCSAFFPGARSFLWNVRRGDRDLLLLLEDREGRWQPPEEQTILGVGAGIRDFTLSPDGAVLYFTSDHPVENAARANLWRVRRDRRGWGTPEPLPGVNSDANESYPSVSRDGTLYFFRGDPGDRSRGDIYSAPPDGGGFAPPRRLVGPVNSDAMDYDPWVSPDGALLIFCSRRGGGYGAGDIYVSHRRSDGAWGEPVNLGPEVNGPAEENRPSVTPDGRYFFFTSDRVSAVELPPGMPPARSMPGGGSRDIYWVESGILTRPGTD